MSDILKPPRPQWSQILIPYSVVWTLPGGLLSDSQSRSAASFIDHLLQPNLEMPCAKGTKHVHFAHSVFIGAVAASSLTRRSLVHALVRVCPYLSTCAVTAGIAVSYTSPNSREKTGGP